MKNVNWDSSDSQNKRWKKYRVHKYQNFNYNFFLNKMIFSFYLNIWNYSELLVVNVIKNSTYHYSSTFWKKLIIRGFKGEFFFNDIQ